MPLLLVLFRFYDCSVLDLLPRQVGQAAGHMRTSQKVAELEHAAMQPLCEGWSCGGSVILNVYQHPPTGHHLRLLSLQKLPVGGSWYTYMYVYICIYSMVFPLHGRCQHTVEQVIRHRRVGSLCKAMRL